MARFPIPFTLPSLHERRRPGLARPTTPMVVLSFCLALVGILGGLALSVPWQVHSAAGPDTITRQSSDKAVVAGTISRLEADQADLKHQIAALRDELTSLQSDSARKKANLSEVNATLEQEGLAAGRVALTGPGVIASYNDSTSATIPANEDPAKYILHDYDLRDIVNTLWAAGAEAIAINDERIMISTPLYCVGPTVICNATRLSPPYMIHAIGDPDALEAALRSAAQMEPLNQRALVYDLPIEVRKDTAVGVAAFNSGYVFRYAKTDDQ